MPKITHLGEETRKSRKQGGRIIPVGIKLMQPQTFDSGYIVDLTKSSLVTIGARPSSHPFIIDLTN